MNYCIHLKKRKNKPYCNVIKEEIRFSRCQECGNKEYKPKSKVNSLYKNKKSTLKGKSPVKSGKMKNKSNKRITVLKETYDYVIKRDNYSCRLCGSTNWIQLHHIYYRSQRKDLINDIDNCIMLCDDCHRLVHSNKKKWQPILLEMNKKIWHFYKIMYNILTIYCCIVHFSMLQFNCSIL